MSARNAFTLVELLVASLVGLVVATVAALALHSGFAAWTHLATDNHEALVAARLVARLERDAAAALPMMDRSFEGTPASLRTTRLAAAATPTLPATPVLVAWSFDSAAQTVAREERRLGEPDTTPPRRETFAPVPAFRLWYGAITAPQRPAPVVWQEVWNPAVHTGLPAAVRVTLRGVERVLPCQIQTATESRE
jgi:prepilin-type N-terminal cleavage/methylation domain-containing protein